MRLPMRVDDNLALLVVDMQNDGLQTNGPLYVEGARDIVPRVAELTDVARRNGLRVLHSQHVHRADGSDFGIAGHFEPLSCVEGTTGKNFYAGMAPAEGDIVVQKRRYSAFQGTDLDLVLRSNGITGLLVAGIQTDACVLSTVVDARNRDYKVWMVSDALAGTTLELHSSALTICDRYFAEVLDLAVTTDRLATREG